MAITKYVEPTHTQPIPISDCAFYRLQAAGGDVLSSNGSYPYVTIQWPSSPTAPANGTEFIIQGHTFTFNTGSNYTATSFKVVNGNRAQSQANFEAMIKANYFFKDVYVSYSGTGNDTTILTWQSCKEEQNFSSAQMDLSAFDAMGCTTDFANGNTPEFVDGYNIIVRIFRGLSPFSEFEPVPFTKGCNTLGGMGKADFDMMPDIRKAVFTKIPDLDNSSVDVPDNASIFQTFSLQYGWVKRDANCQPISGTFIIDTAVMVWNGVIDLEDAYGVRPYFPGATGGLPPGQTHVKFLTTQPGILEVSIDTKCWLWFFVNKNVQTFSGLFAHINWFNTSGGGGISDIAIPGTLGTIDLLCTNASPGFVVDNTGATYDNLSHYTICIFTDGDDQITETVTYRVDRECRESTDLLFTTSLGGIAPIPVEVVAWEVEQSGNEICLDVPCVATRMEKSKWRGRTLSNIVNTQVYTYRLKNAWSQELQAFFADFKRSSQRWVRVQAADGSFVPRKLWVETGGIQIFKDGETIELLVKGSYNYTQAQGNGEPLIYDL